MPDVADPLTSAAAGHDIPIEPIVVSQIEPSMPAALAGMQVGDQIVAINGEPMRSLRAVITYLQKVEGKPVTHHRTSRAARK